MSKENDNLRVMLKLEMKLALEEFKKAYKKTPKGIERIYLEANLTKNLVVIRRLHEQFFRYLLISHKAKEKFKQV